MNREPLRTPVVLDLTINRLQIYVELHYDDIGNRLVAELRYQHEMCNWQAFDVTWHRIHRRIATCVIYRDRSAA